MLKEMTKRKYIFVVDVPERIGHLNASKILIREKNGEFMYIPRAFTNPLKYGSTSFTYEELEDIADKLRELNGKITERENGIKNAIKSIENFDVGELL